MQLRIASRKPQKLRMALYGHSGSGKTMSSLRVAYGLCGDWSRIALIDTEDSSGSLYCHLGPYNTLEIKAPFKASLFQEAINLAEDAGKEVLIIDSLSSEWIGEGGIWERLRTSEKDVAKIEHRNVLNAIKSSGCHIIATLRTTRKSSVIKTDNQQSILEEYPVQQEGIEYPFTTVLRLDQKHKAFVVKDRTGIFERNGPCILEEDHGMLLAGWCRLETNPVPAVLQEKINACNTYAELQMLLIKEDIEDVSLLQAFTARRLKIESGGAEVVGNDLFRA